jgi:type II secretory pathway pseudopilin PulG
MWALGIIATFALMFLALNYGNAIRWQIRAQNAADSAANGVVAIQAERFNVMTATLYASGVEEYRIRRLLDSLLLTIDQSGGCTGSLYPANAAFWSVANGTCNRVYSDLRIAYIRAVNRYSKDLADLNNVTTLNTFTNFKSDAASLLQTYQTCAAAAAAAPTPLPSATPRPTASTSPTCGDTSFKYSFAPYGPQQTTGVAGMQQETGLNSVIADAQEWAIDYAANDANENAELFAPVQADIVTCAIVPPILANFGPIHFAPYYAVGRAAAANVMVEEDWLQPGAVLDTQRGLASFFQNDEPNTPALVPSPAPGTYNGYDTNFGGEQTTAYVNYGVFGATILNDQFDARVGWWGPIPIRPFGGTVVLTGSPGAC